MKSLRKRQFENKIINRMKKEYFFRKVENFIANKKTIVYCLLALLFSCCKANNKSEINELASIDVLKQYPEKIIFLQDIANIDYIRLETNLNTLLRTEMDLKIAHVSDDYIIASNTSDGDVFVFDGSGKSKFSFNHKGPNRAKEYNRITAITFDEKLKEIFICDIFSRKWFVFSEEGSFIRSFNTHISSFIPRDVYNFDDETLLIYDESGLPFQTGFSEHPYFFISKKDGSVIDSLNIHLPIRISNNRIMKREVYLISSQLISLLF